MTLSRSLMFCMAASMMIAPAVQAYDLRCAIGGRCISSQGTKIFIDKARELADACTDFTANDAGRRALRMSVADIHQAVGKNVMHPLMLAHLAFGTIYDSALKFERKDRAEDTRYEEVKASCGQLKRDLGRQQTAPR